MKYNFFKNKYVIFIFYLINYLFTLFCSKTQVSTVSKTDNIVISNIGHAGDAFISMTSIELLRNKFPRAKIFVILSDEGLPVFSAFHHNFSIIKLNHWKLNRKKKSFLLKFFNYYSEFINAYLMLKAVKLDLAIDLYPFFPNCMLLFLLLKIKIRVGFSTFGLPALLSSNYSEKFDITSQYLGDSQIQMLVENNLIVGSINNQVNFLSDSSHPSHRIFDDYIIIHPGSGDKNKVWPIYNWVKLLQTFSSKVIIVGKGDEENKFANEICVNYGDQRVINLVDKLQLKELISFISHSTLVISSDSLIMHIAKHLLVPQAVILVKNPLNFKMWIPKSAYIFLNPEPEFVSNRCNLV